MSESEQWIPCLFRGTKVLVQVDESGTYATDESGRVPMVYKAGGKVYGAAARNLKRLGDGGGRSGSANASARKPSKPGVGPSIEAIRRAMVWKGPPLPETDREGGRIELWTDGACLKNPGPCAAACVILDRHGRREVARYLGRGTNNIGELTAILLALRLVDRPRSAVIVYSDGAYAIGLLTKNWKAKKNPELVAELRSEMRRFSRLRFRKVAGHAGIEENERVDDLARTASQRETDFDRFIPAD